jgi:hypothetical protein
MSDGSFFLRGQEYSYSVISAEGYDGETWEGGDIEDHIQEADRLFYSVEDMGGEVFYRWVGGPFESYYDLEEVIIEDTEVYE